MTLILAIGLVAAVIVFGLKTYMKRQDEKNQEQKSDILDEDV